MGGGGGITKVERVAVGGGGRVKVDLKAVAGGGARLNEVFHTGAVRSGLGRAVKVETRKGVASSSSSSGEAEESDGSALTNPPPTPSRSSSSSSSTRFSLNLLLAPVALLAIEPVRLR